MPNVLIPYQLRSLCQGQASLAVEPGTVGQALQAVLEAHPGLKEQLLDQQGHLRVGVRLSKGAVEIKGEAGTVDLTGSDELSIQLLSHELSTAELARYDRHLTLPEVGLEGQLKLKAARVLMIGTGGLGSPLGLYLAAAGVGTLGILDFDVVDESNLQRQILHGSKDVGRPKVLSARERLSDLNPHVLLQIHQTALTSENALEILAGYDIIVDGTDNFATRYLVNDACVLLGKPNVYGSIFRFEGQVSVFHPAAGAPCYRCLYPEPPPPGMVPSCAEGGVLGVLPGVVGTLQATEILKLILGAGECLRGRLLLFDALAMSFRELKIGRDPACPLCGPSATIKELIDYKEFCGLNRAPQSAAQVSAGQLAAQLAEGERPLLLDVRLAHEWEICNLAEWGARLVPLDLLPDSLDQFDREADIVVHCKTGGRSAKAQKILLEAGFRRVRNLSGGILAWCDEVDSNKKKY
ncbi:MAG: molybdopterin-synthase adenylyltransferase MoeB [Vulcanimicrobiota bacterium]